MIFVMTLKCDKELETRCSNFKRAYPGLAPGYDGQADPAPPAYWFATFEKRLDKCFEQLTPYNEHQMKEVKDKSKWVKEAAWCCFE